jgi:hypothetical protein
MIMRAHDENNNKDDPARRVLVMATDAKKRTAVLARIRGQKRGGQGMISWAWQQRHEIEMTREKEKR